MCGHLDTSEDADCILPAIRNKKNCTIYISTLEWKGVFSRIPLKAFSSWYSCQSQPGLLKKCLATIIPKPTTFIFREVKFLFIGVVGSRQSRCSLQSPPSFRILSFSIDSHQQRSLKNCKFSKQTIRGGLECLSHREINYTSLIYLKVYDVLSVQQA